MAALEAHVGAAANGALRRLQLRQLVEQVDGAYRLSNILTARWINERALD